MVVGQTNGTVGDFIGELIWTAGYSKTVSLNVGETIRMPVSTTVRLRNTIKYGCMYLWDDEPFYSTVSQYETESYGTSMAFYRHTEPTYAPYIEVQYDDAPVPPTVSAATPRSMVVDATQELTFSWTYHQSFNQPQTHFDLQFWHNGEWEYLAEFVESSEHSFTIPPNTLPGDIPSGETRWRVRSAIENGAGVSEWSEAPFIVRAAPPTPNITNASNTPRPSFVWQSPIQNGYQVLLERISPEIHGEVPEVIATIFESPTIFGTDVTWKYPGVLEDGRYRFSVRVVSELSLWSQWATAYILVENQPTGTIQLSAQASCRSTMLLNWTDSEEREDYFILRNGVPLAKTLFAEYEDFTSLGKTLYTVRTFDGDFYTDSNMAADTVRVENGVISPLPVSEWLKLERRRGGRPEHSETVTPDVVFVQYEDEDTETGYTSGYKSEEHKLSFTFKSEQDYMALKALAGKMIVYKDRHNTLVTGILGQLSSRIDHAKDFDFSIRRAKYVEEIPYD